MELFLVLEYMGFSEGIVKNDNDFLRNPINFNKRNYSLNKLCIFPDKDSSIIWTSRVKEINNRNTIIVNIKKITVATSDEDLRDKDNIYAVLNIEEKNTFNGAMFFQDEINAEIHNLAIRKAQGGYFSTYKIPLSQELRLKNSGNLSSEPKFLDLFSKKNYFYRF